MKKCMFFKYYAAIFLIGVIFLMPAFSLLPVFADEIYDFSDEAQAKFDAQVEKKNVIKEEQPKLKPSKKSNKQTEQLKPQDIKTDNINSASKDLHYIVIKKGNGFGATLQSSISSASLDKNDTIAAVLENDWIYKGVLIAPAGSILYGNATTAKKASFLMRDGSVSVMFNELMTPDGSRMKLSSNAVSVAAHSRKGGRIVRNIAVGAISGLVSGLLYTLISGGDIPSGIAIGASVGAAGGVVTSAFQKGEDIEIPAGTSIDIVLTENMNAVPYQQ